MKTTLTSIKKTVCILIAVICFSIANAQSNNNAPVLESLQLLGGNVESSLPSKVTVNWSTAADVNVVNFEIERSFDLNNFTTVAIITDEFSSDEKTNNYKINDASLALSGKNIAYYRIKQANIDGSITTSEIKIVSLKN